MNYTLDKIDKVRFLEKKHPIIFQEALEVIGGEKTWKIYKTSK